MIRLLSTIALALTLATGTAACSETNQAIDKAQGAANDAAHHLPDVNWSKYGRDLKRKIDGLVADADCGKLRRELRQADDGKKTDLTKYIQHALDDAGCH